MVGKSAESNLARSVHRLDEPPGYPSVWFFPIVPPLFHLAPPLYVSRYVRRPEVDHVNKFRHDCKCQRRGVLTGIHIVGIRSAGAMVNVLLPIMAGYRAPEREHWSGRARAVSMSLTRRNRSRFKRRWECEPGGTISRQHLTCDGAAAPAHRTEMRGRFTRCPRQPTLSLATVPRPGKAAVPLPIAARPVPGTCPYDLRVFRALPKR